MVDRSSRMGSARQREIIRKRLASRGHPYRVQPGTSRMKGFTTYEQIRADLDIPVEQRPAVRAQKRLEDRAAKTGSIYRTHREPGSTFKGKTRVSYETVREALKRAKKRKGSTTPKQIRATSGNLVEQSPATRAQKRLDRRIELTGSVYRINTEPGKKFHKNTRVINLVSYEDVRNAIERRKKPK